VHTAGMSQYTGGGGAVPERYENVKIGIQVSRLL
jgi:hypothetical protein